MYIFQGEEVFRRLKEAGLKRGIRIRVAQNQPSSSSPDTDTVELQALGIAVVRNLDFKRLVGAGILHTKLWVVDGKHFFVGSANMDWRALTQVISTFFFFFLLILKFTFSKGQRARGCCL